MTTDRMHPTPLGPKPPTDRHASPAVTTDRSTHLARRARAQTIVPEDEMVDAVRAVLARHDG